MIRTITTDTATLPALTDREKIAIDALAAMFPLADQKNANELRLKSIRAGGISEYLRMADHFLIREANILDTARRAVDALGGTHDEGEYGIGFDEALNLAIAELDKLGTKDRFQRGKDFVG